MECSNACFIIALALLQRLIESDEDLAWRDTSVHRLFLTAAVVAAKSHDDEYQANSYYALVGGIRCSELNSLELRFLKQLNWRVRVSQEEYLSYTSLVDGFDPRQSAHRARIRALHSSVAMPSAAPRRQLALRVRPIIWAGLPQKTLPSAKIARRYASARTLRLFAKCLCGLKERLMWQSA